MDIKTAYLNADIDEKIFMQHSEGLEKFDKQGNPLVCKLKKSLYGLKQSGRNLPRNLNNQKFLLTEVKHDRIEDTGNTIRGKHEDAKLDSPERGRIERRQLQSCDYSVLWGA